ncbi:MAG: hypothetical protein FWF90_06135 [Promicromonosporaceae bacterium]|nr:hypothetical protein [Promicromonosporaceae bacterium]
MPRYRGGAAPSADDEIFERLIHEEYGPDEPTKRWGAWRPTEDQLRRRRQRATAVRAVALALVVAAVAWAVQGVPGLPPEWSAVLTPWHVRSAAEVAALTGELDLTPQGLEVFRSARPELVNATRFGDACVPVDGTLQAVYEVSACYVGGGHGVVGRVYLEVPPGGPAPRSYQVRVAAHELLLAAWDTLGGATQARLGPVVAREAASIRRLDTTVDGEAAGHAAEEFADVGTLVWRDGGVDPALEAVYARWFADRHALVAHDGA